MILETTWMTPSGWLVVHDVLTIGPWRAGHSDETSHTRPPTDQDADHMLVRVLECTQGQVQIEAVCEPMFDYGRTPARWQMSDHDWGTAEATDGATTLRIGSDLRLGIEGNRVRARHTMQEGEKRFVALGWEHGFECPNDLKDAVARVRATSHYLARLACGRPVPRPSLADAPAALGPHAQGADVRADRSDGGSRDHVASGDPRWGT
jgi:hypothetical protein